MLVYDGESTDDSMASPEPLRPGAGAGRFGRTRVEFKRRRGTLASKPRPARSWASSAATRSSRRHTCGAAVDALLRMRADLVGGPVRAVADTPIGAAIAIATSTPYGVGGARHHYLTEPAYVDTVFMGVARRETWLRYPFNEEFVRNQDDELSYRLLDAGGRIALRPGDRELVPESINAARLSGANTPTTGAGRSASSRFIRARPESATSSRLPWLRRSARVRS